MATEEAKKNCRRKEGYKTNTIGVDQISKLPDPLIHHILSFLPTFYAVRTSILSKRWRYMWIYTPLLHFEDSKDVTFLKMSIPQMSTFFVKFVSNYLKHRNLFSQFSEDTFITRLKLDMETTYYFGDGIHGNIDDCLSNVVNGNLKELDLCIKPGNVISKYCLPQSVFNSRSLTLLTLKRLKLSIDFPASLPSLKSLCLESVKCDTYSIQNLMSGCPIIEDLRLGDFDFFPHETDLAFSGTLRNLTLWSMRLTNQQFDYLVCGIPLLEKLTVSSCSNLKNISIHSYSLKSLFLGNKCSIEAKITTPNLVSFVFEGGVESAILIFDSPNLLEANLKLHDTHLDWTCFHLILFLSYFKCFKKMTLCLLFKENLIIPENVRNICCQPLPNLKHLKVKTHNTSARNSELRDTFLWCAPSVETLEMEKE